TGVRQAPFRLLFFAQECVRLGGELFDMRTQLLTERRIEMSRRQTRDQLVTATLVLAVPLRAVADRSIARWRCRHCRNRRGRFTTVTITDPASLGHWRFVGNDLERDFFVFVVGTP